MKIRDAQLTTLKQAALGHLWWEHSNFMRSGNYAGSKETVIGLVKAHYLRWVVNTKTFTTGAKITPRGRELVREWTGL